MYVCVNGSKLALCSLWHESLAYSCLVIHVLLVNVFFSPLVRSYPLWWWWYRVLPVSCLPLTSSCRKLHIYTPHLLFSFSSGLEWTYFPQLAQTLQHKWCRTPLYTRNWFIRGFSLGRTDLCYFPSGKNESKRAKKSYALLFLLKLAIGRLYWNLKYFICIQILNLQRNGNLTAWAI